jgi:D-beta-D-heptose 7-phosphate kinase/D-beta-D-heptose 1-phosphate adenosyltransferase
MLIKKNIIKNINKFNCIIVSDYGKGTCSRQVIKFIIKISNRYKIPALIDPKKDCKNFKLYSNCYCLKPNFKEIKSVFPNIQNNEANIKKYLKLIKKKHNIKNVILTRSEKGSILLNESNKFYKFKSNTQKTIDVTGAGDTYIASLGFFLTLKKNILFACKMSNETSGITVGHIGTYSVSKKELNKKLKLKF